MAARSRRFASSSPCRRATCCASASCCPRRSKRISARRSPTTSTGTRHSSRTNCISTRRLPAVTARAARLPSTSPRRGARSWTRCSGTRPVGARRWSPWYPNPPRALPRHGSTCCHAMRAGPCHRGVAGSSGCRSDYWSPQRWPRPWFPFGRSGTMRSSWTPSWRRRGAAPACRRHCGRNSMRA